jgi:phenylalanyl-tRNA synthetase beta chain
MKVPISWLKEYVDIELDVEQLSRRLTMAGLEVESIALVGLPKPQAEHYEFSYSGLSWEPDKIVVAQIDEVLPHPNADRLVLCRLQDGAQEHLVLTGAPNLFEYKGIGPLAQPIKVAYAKEGARIYDGHQPGQVLTTLKRAKIRGVESYSMVCSEKELGISEEHEGIILLPADAPTGMALVDYMGDAVLDISILPNMARNTSILGVAREVAALTGKRVRPPQPVMPADGPAVDGLAAIQITEPEYNPRFVLGLVRGVRVGPSPFKIQRQLRLAGMRPINNIVDATNYIMLAVGEPLHAFDYSVLVRRAGGAAPTIITRRAAEGEKLTTLDGVEHSLDPFNVLVCDTAGALSIAGVMGGAESEVSDATSDVLLEGASWNYINIRRTMAAQKMSSEAAYRFSRGVHPELAPTGVRMGLDCMAAWSGGQIAVGLVDAYPAPVRDPQVALTAADIRRGLGIDLTLNQVCELLEPLEFACQIQGNTLYAQTPPHRLDIGEGLVGVADLVEEVARLYGYDRLPATRLSDPLPPAEGDPSLPHEEKVRDLLARMGLQEVITYRMTLPEREKRLWLPGSPEDGAAYLKLANPITPERSVMRRSLLASVMDAAEKNARTRARLALFEIGPAFHPRAGGEPSGEGRLPDETAQVAIVLAGQRRPPAWDDPDPGALDFYDLKGILESLLDGLHIFGAVYEPVESYTFHPGKCAQIRAGERVLGVFGELHPQVKARYDFGGLPGVLAAELDLGALLAAAQVSYAVAAVPAHPPVLEDIAVVVDEGVPAARVAEVIRLGGGKLLVDLRLFDIFRGEQIGAGKKSLAYALTYQAPDHTLTDKDAAGIRQRIVRRLEQELGGKIRSE